MSRRTKFRVNLVVETTVSASTPEEAAEKAEHLVQALFDRGGKRLNAVVGADFGDVQEAK
jgi:hypothetical protein